MQFFLSLVLVVMCGLLGSGAHAAGAPDTMNSSLDTLEKKYFQHTYEADLTDNRLERLEKMVFGEARTGTDSARLSSLVAIASSAQDDVPAPNSSSSSSGQASSGSNTTAQAPPSDPDNDIVADSSDYPRVTALEQEMLGKTFTNEPVKRRVGQLEAHAFGHPSTIDDLGARVDRLEQYAVANLHVKPFGINPIMNDDPNNQVLTDNSPSSPFPLPRSYRSQAPAQPAQPTGPAPQPTASAPMLTKVAWMENIVFGHEFDDEHLLERLARLDAHFFPNDAHTSDKLMDETDQLMSATALLEKDGTKPATQIASAAGASDSDEQQRAHKQNPMFRSISSAFSSVERMTADTGNYNSMNPNAYPMGFMPGFPSLPPGVGGWF